MTSVTATVETGHEDMIHDAQFDYYSRRVATASSDRTVKVFDVAGETQTLVADLKGHEGPVWQVAWAHPKFDSVLASCSYDTRVIVWKEGANGWQQIKWYSGHESSVNSIAWAPHDFGLTLAAGSSDGHISVLVKPENEDWQAKKFHAHLMGCNAVSWAPPVPPGSLVAAGPGSSPALTMRFVSGGCDSMVKIWRYSEAESQWILEHQLAGHSDWVRDVAWAPNVGLPTSTIASCSQDKTVVIWQQDDPSSEWTMTALPEFPDVVWRVSWAVTGNILAVSSGDNKVTLWKQSVDDGWTCLSAMSEGGIVEEVAA